MKYNVGDKVRVRGDLSREHGAVAEMLNMAGKEVTIKRVLNDLEGYFIEEDRHPVPFIWGDWMFERPTAPNKMPKLTTGMFGKETDGDIFVVVNDRIIYQSGMYEDVEWVEEHPEEVVALYEADCFAEVEDGFAKVIWKYAEETEEPKEEVKEEVKEVNPDKKDDAEEFAKFLLSMALLGAIAEEVKKSNPKEQSK